MRFIKDTLARFSVPAHRGSLCIHGSTSVISNNVILWPKKCFASSYLINFTSLNNVYQYALCIIRVPCTFFLNVIIIFGRETGRRNSGVKRGNFVIELYRI